MKGKKLKKKVRILCVVVFSLYLFTFLSGCQRDAHDVLKNINIEDAVKIKIEIRDSNQSTFIDEPKYSVNLTNDSLRQFTKEIRSIISKIRENKQPYIDKHLNNEPIVDLVIYFDNSILGVDFVGILFNGADSKVFISGKPMIILHDNYANDLYFDPELINIEMNEILNKLGVSLKSLN